MLDAAFAVWTMQFVTSLIIFSGFVFVICLGLVRVVWDLSRVSVYDSPHMMACEEANGNESSNAADFGDTI